MDDFSVVKLKGNANNWSKVLFPQLHQLSVDDLSVDNVQKWIQIPDPQLPSLEDLGNFMYNVTNMFNIPVPQLPSLEDLSKFMDNVSKELNIPVPIKGLVKKVIFALVIRVLCHQEKIFDAVS